MPSCTLQVFLDHAWVDIAQLEAFDLTRGYDGPSQLDYDIDYAVGCLGARDHRAVSCGYAVGFDVHTRDVWPAFVFDLMPNGAGRQALLKSLKLRDQRSVDWDLLLKGAGHPPGNLRVAEAAALPTERCRGFSREEIAARSEDFVAVMAEVGSLVAGASVQGEAPKFLLTQDERGLFHPDGALPDVEARAHWLVKYPRNTRDSDRVVLRNEAAYHRVAASVGLATHGMIEHEHDTLFIPRFDRRVTRRGVERFGLESLASLADVAAFGSTVSHQDQCAALAGNVDDPIVAIREYILRDILNLALGNTDNHARNTAVRKLPDGVVELSPLYDFAPMFLDEDAIPRASKWDDHERLSIVDWPAVIQALPLQKDGRSTVRDDVVAFLPRLRQLPEKMQAVGVDIDIIDRRTGRIDELIASLDVLVPLQKRTKGEK